MDIIKDINNLQVRLFTDNDINIWTDPYHYKIAYLINTGTNNGYIQEQINGDIIKIHFEYIPQNREK